MAKKTQSASSCGTTVYLSDKRGTLKLVHQLRRAIIQAGEWADEFPDGPPVNLVIHKAVTEALDRRS